MTSLSIRFDRFNFGSSSLDTQRMFPEHKKKIEECLSKIYNDTIQNRSASNKDTPFQIQFKTGKPTLIVGGENILLNKSPELNRIQRIVRYYQNTGQLPRTEIDRKEILERNAETRKTVRAINQASIPGANGSILAGMRLADDSLTLARNIMFAIPEMGPNDPIANHLGYYAGALWAFFAFREIDDGITENKRSVKIGDGEGKRRAEARILSGGLMSTGSIAYLGAKFCDTLATPAAVATSLSVSNVLFGIGALLAVGASAVGAIRCQRFNKRLSDYLENPKLTEEQSLRGALRFLKDSIGVTAEEKADCKAQIDEEHPDWTPEQKTELLRQKLIDLTEVKVKYMKRRTSNKSLRLILNHADDLIERLGDKSTRAEAIKETMVLMNTIRQENRIKLILYTLGLIASVLSFAGMFIIAFLSGGTLPFILFGIAGTIYIAVTLYTISSLFVKKENVGTDTLGTEKQPELPCQTPKIDPSSISSIISSPKKGCRPTR